MHAKKDRGNNRPLPMPPFRLNANRKGIRDSEKEDRINYRPISKPPYILNVDGKVIGIIENGNLPYICDTYENSGISGEFRRFWYFIRIWSI